MTREAFIDVLESSNYFYRVEGNKIIVTRGNTHLNALTSIYPDVTFKNDGDVYLNSLPSLPPGVEFKNEGNVYLKSLIDGWFDEWSGNIEGIDSKRLLNKMISLGLFERRR
jgi:hypothetical protein